MILVTDANILVRCCIGHGRVLVGKLRAAGITLVATEHNANECLQVLVKKMNRPVVDAVVETALTLKPFEVLGPNEYDLRRADAALRLREGGQSDWPALAAALTLGADIWSDDTDFFGVGVPVWTSMTARKVLLAPASRTNG